MNEILIFFLSVFLGGLGYFIVNWHLSPVLKYRNMKQKIASTLVFRMNIIANASYGSCDSEDDVRESTSLELRQLASDIRGLNNTIDGSPILRALYGVPKKKELHDVAARLFFLSNSLSPKPDDFARELNQGAIYERIAGIEDSLNLEITKSAKEISKMHKETAKAINQRRAKTT
jgi:hypothetical protein